MTTTDTRTQAIGAYIATAHERHYPAEVIDAARLCLADWMAVAIGAANEDAGRIVRETSARWGTQGRATVIFGATATPAVAALANGTLAHCLDFDDTYVPAITHTSAPVWAAVLALAEEHDVDDAAMLRAFVTGFEVTARIGRGLGQALTSRGLHSTGAFGRIGAAAAAAALLRLDAVRAQHALAAAATQVSGLAASFGTMAKPFHAGKAAMDGVLSAEMAKAGFMAAPATLSPGGLDKALIQDGSVGFAPIDFAGFEILNNSFKPYAACHLVHPAIDAARRLAAEGAEIRRVVARVSPLAMQITGGASGDPATALAAKFDLRYCTALGLAGHTASALDFAEPWRPLDAALAKARMIEPVLDPAMTVASAALDVELGDGSRHTIDIRSAKGHPGNPMGWSDMWSKLEALTAPVVGRECEALFQEIKALASGGTRAKITARLRALDRAMSPVNSGARAENAAAK